MTHNSQAEQIRRIEESTRVMRESQIRMEGTVNLLAEGMKHDRKDAKEKFDHLEAKIEKNEKMVNWLFIAAVGGGGVGGASLLKVLTMLPI